MTYSFRWWIYCCLLSLSLVPLEETLAQDTAVSSGSKRFEVPADDQMPGSGPIHRDEWFQTIWNERRSRWADRRERDQAALVFLGDSITQGWGGNLRRHFEGIKVANRGISGDTSRGVLYRLQDDVLSLEPSGIVLLIGTNDIGMGAEPETVAANIKLIIDQCEAYNPQMPIVLCQVMPSSAQQSRPKEKISALNKLITKLAEEEPQVTVLDTWKFYTDPVGDALPDEFPDLLHPNEEGYRKWAAALRPILATLGFWETEPDDFEPEEGFEMLFNGHDLTGWGYRPTSEEDIASRNRWQASDPDAAVWPIVTEAISFDGKQQSMDGRFKALNGRLVVTTPSEGRKVQQLFTEREFDGDFVLRLEFRATPFADSGVYVRGPQLQCRDYTLAGPYNDLKEYKPQQWNELEVTVTGNKARATCNGEVLEKAMALPDSGPIGVEGDRGQMEYRRIRIKLTD